MYDNTIHCLQKYCGFTYYRASLTASTCNTYICLPLDKSPLHMAAYDGAIRLVRALISYGANLEAKDDTMRTPIHWAARQGHFQVFRYLKDQQASMQHMAADGTSQNPTCPTSFMFHKASTLDVL